MAEPFEFGFTGTHVLSDVIDAAPGPCEQRTTVMHRGGGTRWNPVRRESLVG